jgi:hypothetical protein
MLEFGKLCTIILKFYSHFIDIDTDLFPFELHLFQLVVGLLEVFLQGPNFVSLTRYFHLVVFLNTNDILLHPLDLIV